MVQDTWQRRAAADQGAVRNPQAWLTPVATRIAIDALRAAPWRRESYVAGARWPAVPLSRWKRRIRSPGIQNPRKTVASFYTEDGEIIINRGDPWTGRSRVAEMASGFNAGVPDLNLVCNEIRMAGDHAIFVRRFTGHDATTGNPLENCGWEEWEIGPDMKHRKRKAPLRGPFAAV